MSGVQRSPLPLPQIARSCVLLLHTVFCLQVKTKTLVSALAAMGVQEGEKVRRRGVISGGSCGFSWQLTCSFENSTVC